MKGDLSRLQYLYVKAKLASPGLLGEEISKEGTDGKKDLSQLVLCFIVFC